MFVQVGSGVGCVVLYCESPLCLDFVGFFILFGLWCRLRCS